MNNINNIDTHNIITLNINYLFHTTALHNERNLQTFIELNNKYNFNAKYGKYSLDLNNSKYFSLFSFINYCCPLIEDDVLLAYHIKRSLRLFDGRLFNASNVHYNYCASDKKKYYDGWITKDLSYYEIHLFRPSEVIDHYELINYNMDIGNRELIKTINKLEDTYIDFMLNQKIFAIYNNTDKQISYNVNEYPDSITVPISYKINDINDLINFELFERINIISFI